MQLLPVLFAVCCCAAVASKSSASEEQRYTLLAESKKKDHELDRQPSDVGEAQPWRRLNYVGYGGQHNAWPAAAPGSSLASPMGPGLLLLGVNLGALLYMLLGLLGLAPAPPQRFSGTWQGADMYRNDRQDFKVGKESDMYF